MSHFARSCQCWRTTAWPALRASACPTLTRLQSRNAWSFVGSFFFVHMPAKVLRSHRRFLLQGPDREKLRNPEAYLKRPRNACVWTVCFRLSVSMRFKFRFMPFLSSHCCSAVLALTQGLDGSAPRLPAAAAPDFQAPLHFRPVSEVKEGSDAGTPPQELEKKIPEP